MIVRWLSGRRRCLWLQRASGAGLAILLLIWMSSLAFRAVILHSHLGCTLTRWPGSECQEIPVSRLFLEPSQADIALLKLSRYRFAHDIHLVSPELLLVAWIYEP